MVKSESKVQMAKFWDRIDLPLYSQHYHDLAMKDIELQADRDRWKRPSIWSEDTSKKQENGMSK